MIAEEPAANRAVVTSSPDGLHAAFEEIAGMPEARFSDFFASNERTNGPTLHAIFSIPTPPGWIELKVPLDARRSAFRSLTQRFPALGWYEREIAEQFHVEVEGHPHLVRLTHPADAIPQLAQAPPGVVDYPLGPVRSGVVESAHYTLRTVGEELLDCALQLFYKHRGAEQRAEGLPLTHASLIAERISGTSAFNNSLAFLQAVEAAAEVAVPIRARALRTVFGELERIYNHLGAFADLAQATGLAVAQAQFEILKERQLRLHALLTGHRYLFGTNVAGGLACDLDAAQIAGVRDACRTLRESLQPLEAMYFSTPSHVDRLVGTGILSHEDALLFGAVGPIGRAAGVDRDARREHPYAGYADVDFAVPLESAGDAMARARVRFSELHESIRIVEQICDRVPSGEIRVEGVSPSPGSTGFGWAESAHGETLAWIAIGDDGTLRRYRARPASYANWQAFSVAIPGHNILTDFPVIEQSFNLSVAGADR